MQGGYKVVILDEADYLNPQSTQPALRAFIEEFSNNCRFILTCNFKNRIIEPLHSRCGVYEFNTSKKDQIKLCEGFLKRAQNILGNEDVFFQDGDLVSLIMKHTPDWRRVLNEAQRHSIDGSLQLGRSKEDGSSDIVALAKALKDKNFKTMRRWVVDHVDMDTVAIFRALYDNMSDLVEPSSVPQLVLILADYQYKNAFVADHELNTVACMTEIMAGVKFK